MSERSDEFITWTSAVCVCGGVIAGFLHSVKWLFYPVVITTAVSFALLLVAGYPRARDWAETRTAQRRERLKRRPTSNIGSTWRYTANGFDAGQVMTTLSKAPLLPGTRPMMGEESWSSFKLGIVVSCEPLSNLLSTSQLREKFVAFLEQPLIRRLVSEVSTGSEELLWKNYGSNGRIGNSAILVREDDQTMDFFAWSLLGLRDHQSANIPYFAELIIQIEMRTADSSLAPPLNFLAWHNLLVDSLHVVSSFADFLRSSAKVSTFGYPSPQVGVRFAAPRDISQMIEQGELISIPGSPRAQQFSSYLVAEDEGESASDAVWELLRGVADHAMYLNGYEGIFQQFGGSSGAS